MKKVKPFIKPIILLTLGIVLIILFKDKYIEYITNENAGYIDNSLNNYTISNFEYYETRHRTAFSEYRIYHFIYNIFDWKIKIDVFFNFVLKKWIDFIIRFFRAFVGKR